MSNSFDTDGNQLFTKFTEWEVACHSRGLQGPIDDELHFQVIFRDSKGNIQANWNKDSNQGILNKFQP